MLSKIIELLLVGTVGVGALVVAFIVGDVLGGWFFPRLERAIYRMAWWDVALKRHKRRVKV